MPANGRRDLIRRLKVKQSGILVTQTVNTAAHQISVQTKPTLHLVDILSLPTAFCVSTNHVQFINKHAYWPVSVPPAGHGLPRCLRFHPTQGQARVQIPDHSI